MNPPANLAQLLTWPMLLNLLTIDVPLRRKKPPARAAVDESLVLQRRKKVTCSSKKVSASGFQMEKSSISTQIVPRTKEGWMVVLDQCIGKSTGDSNKGAGTGKWCQAVLKREESMMRKKSSQQQGRKPSGQNARAAHQRTKSMII